MESETTVPIPAAPALGAETLGRPRICVVGAGRHKTSMLRDIEAGRLTEIDALVGAVIELAYLTGTPAPNIEAIHACTRLLERSVCSPAPATFAAARVAVAA